MKHKPFNKNLVGKNSKDLLNLIGAKEERLQNQDMVLPSGATEITIFNFWKTLLGHDNFGVTNDFFLVGGNSLKAIQLLSRISSQFFVHLSLADIFLQPTIAQIAVMTEAKKNGKSSLASSIRVKERPAFIPLSFNQERLWFIDQLEGSAQYHIPAVLRLNGKLNKDALAFAITQIINRHEVLRTVIREAEGQAYQFIQQQNGWQLSSSDGAAYKKDPAGLQQYVQQLINRPFDLAKDHMLRAELIGISEQEHVLVVTLHHIASDGWSTSIIINELVELYQSFEEGTIAQLEPLSIQYADFSIWQQEYLKDEILDKKLAYWKQKLEGTTALQLPTDYARSVVQSFNGGFEEFAIDKKLSDDLQALSRQQGVTLFMTLLAAFKVLLFRYTGQTDISVGTAIAGRQQQELERLIGFFVNTLALRSHIDHALPFTELLSQVKTTTLEAFENQEVPFEKVVEAVVKERDMSRSPLFQVMFILQNTPEKQAIRLGEIVLTEDTFKNNKARFELEFSLIQTQHGLQGSMEYCTDLFNEQTIKRMLGHFVELLRSVVKAPHQIISLLPMLSGQEEQKLLSDFNDTQSPYPDNKGIISLFEDQVKKTPEAIAVAFEEQRLSYQELNQRANQLARFLTARGITANMLVPICIRRSSEMIVGILGILKTGAAFVPVDPDYPADRINYMLTDTGAKIIVSTKESQGKLQQAENLNIVHLDSDWPLISEQPANNLPIVVSPNHLAYVIHTSGSTGMPKGVMIEHGAVVNLLTSISGIVNFTSTHAFLSVTTFSFDICYLEFFVPLINGGKLIIVSREVAIDGFRLAESISFYQPTHLQATPATWQLLLDAGWNNREEIKILIGGEAIKEEIKNALTKIGEVYNLYGPTETTIWSVAKKLAPNEKVLIGKPVANTSIYIVGKLMELVPVGVAGEICIGGAGLARGYLNRTDLTDQKFIDNPFSNVAGSRIYKTGDMGRWLPDGNLECLGRIDDQVKIRGYRIELGEIESVLMQSDLINQAVVLAKEDKENNKRLIGYYVPKWQAVKAKELELYERQVESWKEIYETEYALGEASVDEEFDINIWKDSFSGEPIGETQMQEWLQDIVNVILSEKTGNVLEIGCGTGLIYYQLAGKVNKYIGTDFSNSSINHITQRIEKGLRDYGPTRLMVGAAHEISLEEDEQVDTIILNSIVQYFPGEEYMNDVMMKCISMLNNGGRIVIGDVRDNRLLELFKGRLQIQNMVHSVNIREFKWAVEQAVLKEEELCFCPEYFYRLKSVYPAISHVEIKWKDSLSINELTLYRYTVVIHVGAPAETVKPDWQNWKAPADKQIVMDQLDGNKNLIAIKDVPNFRLWRERLLNKALSEKSVDTIGDLLQFTGKEDEGTLEVENIIRIAKAKGYHIHLLLNEDPLKINLAMELNCSGKAIQKPRVETEYGKDILYTNIPLFNDISLLLQKDLKSLLKQRLPEYMVPSELVALSQLPLTNNGKVDRRFLSLRDEKAVANNLNYKAPATGIEQMLASVWQELLGVDRIGIYDNFFELGGHSLLAMRVISAVKKELGQEIAIKDIFSSPTLAGLANLLETEKNVVLQPAIEAGPRPEHIPLSFSQERLLFIDQLEGSVHYHLPEVIRLKGKLNVDALSYSLQQIINRHEVLRTVFTRGEGQAYQSIRDKDQWHLSEVDGSLCKEDHDGLKEYIKELIKKPFNLSVDYMLRAVLIRLDDKDHILVVTMHHIASDAWSATILVKEVATFYKAYVKGRQANLLPLKIQYADYAIWQRRLLQGEALKQKLGYWKNKLAGVAPLELPVDYSRPLVQNTRGAVERFEIQKSLAVHLHDLGLKQGATLFMTLLSAFKVLLYRYSRQEDICVGSPIANRTNQESEDLIGFFINTLALRSSVHNDLSFTGLLQQVKQTTLEAYDHQDIPFEKIVEAAVKERDMSRSPLFQVVFVLQNTPEAAAVDLGEVELTGESFIPDTAKFELTFSFTERNGILDGTVEYNTDLYAAGTIRQMIAHFKELLVAIVNEPQQMIGALPMLSQAEEQQLLLDFNNTDVAWPKDKTIINLFETQVSKTPATTAVIFEKEQISYRQLNERSNQLAHYLRSIGVKEETLVPVCIERGINMIVAILGILKAGGVYVPIDPEYPAERISYMLEDTAAPTIVTSQYALAKLPASTDLNYIQLDSDWETISGYPASNPDITVQPNHLAYIIYTSGSTGKPKGVMIEHCNVVRLFETEQPLYDFNEKDVWTMFHSFCFDFSVWEMYGALFYGGRLVMVSSAVTKDAALFSSLILSEGVTVLNQTPAAFYVLQDALVDKAKQVPVRFVIFGGEALNPAKLKPWKEAYPESRLINMYGITETTVHVTFQEIGWHQINNGNSIIGKPIPTLQCYVLDTNRNLAPVGVAGELYVGGAGVARGYLNRAELTAARFIHDIFSNEAGEKLYVTGDLCRWLPNGTLEYLGRIDDQVKIRGYRIELGEIESVLQQSGLVSQSVVLAKANSEGTKRLISYVVPAEGYTKEAATAFLHSRLPEYMVPQLWVELDLLPLTSNGKVNKKALPDVDAANLASNEYVEPRNELEKSLAATWQKLLGIERIGIHDNFFELGGDSILTIQVVSRMRSHGYELQPRDIFIHQTISRLSAALSYRTVAESSGEQGTLQGHSG